MLVAFLSLTNGTSPATCMAKAASAFLVFAGFGLVLRFALTESTDGGPDATPQKSADGYPSQLDVIVPGTSVADLLGVREEPNPGDNDEPQVAV